MDPFSIATDAIGLSTIATRCTWKLAKFLRDAKQVDEELRSFHDEIVMLETSLRISAKTLALTEDLADVPNLKECLESAQNIIRSATKSIERLLVVISGLSSEEAHDLIARAQKRSNLDDAAGELQSLRAQLLSYNTSFLTLFHAMSITLSVIAQGQTKVPPTDPMLMSSVQDLGEHIENLRIDIRKHSGSSIPQSIGDEMPVQLITSMELVKVAAEQVYSSASTVTNLRSVVASIDTDDPPKYESARIDQHLLSSSRGQKADNIASGSAAIATADNPKAEQLSGMIEEIRLQVSRDLFRARDLCLEAVEMSRTLDGKVISVDYETVVLLLAIIYSLLNDSESIAEAHKWLAKIDKAELTSEPPSHVKLEKLNLLSWTYYHTHDFDEAEKYCLVRINFARQLSELDDMKEYYSSVVLMVFIKICQYQFLAAEKWERLVPDIYLEEKSAKLFQQRKPFGKRHSDWRVLPQSDITHAAALHEFPLGATKNFSNDQVITALQFAAAGGYVGVVAIFLCQGFAISSYPLRRSEYSCEHCAQKEFTSLLQVAAFHGRHNVLDFILQTSGRLEIVDPLGAGVREAAARNDMRAARCILNGGTHLQDYWDRHFGNAIRQSQVQFVELMLHEAINLIDINRVDEETGMSRLNLACSVGSPEIVGLLLDEGANTEQIDADGHTPLSRTVNTKVSEGTLQVLKLLLDRGFSPESRTGEMEPPTDRQHSFGIRKRSFTPLHIALQGGYLEYIKPLIDAGANPMAVVPYTRQTCFHLAVDCAPTQSNQLLLQALLTTKHPIDLNFGDGIGQDSIVTIAKRSHFPPETIELLYQHGAKRPSRFRSFVGMKD